VHFYIYEIIDGEAGHTLFLWARRRARGRLVMQFKENPCPLSQLGRSFSIGHHSGILTILKPKKETRLKH